MSGPAILVRRLLRAAGLAVHVGWKATHRSGFELECVGCGERRSAFQLDRSYNAPSWWETTASGDGSCGAIAELPTRVRP